MRRLVHVMVFSAALLGLQPGAAGSQEPESPAARALAGADSLTTAEPAADVRYTYAWDARGPWAIHVVEVDGSSCAVTVESRKAGPPLHSRARVADLAAGAAAAVNADFYRLPAGVPVGAHVEHGEVLVGPGDWPVVAWSDTGAWLGAGALTGWLATRTDTITVAQVNRRVRRGSARAGGAALFTHWYGAETQADTDAAAVLVQRIGDAGGTGVRAGVVLRASGGDEPLPLDTGTVAFLAPADGAGPLTRVAPGDTVWWRVELRSADEPGRPAALHAVGGFPELVRDGAVSQAARAGVGPAFGERRHPRTAVATAGDGRTLLLVVVDGRSEGYSEGMTLAELTALLLRLGARHAINLDGGGSTTLVLDGRVRNRPSDLLGERPVANAIVVRSDPDRCR